MSNRGPRWIGDQIEIDSNGRWIRRPTHGHGGSLTERSTGAPGRTGERTQTAAEDDGRTDVLQKLKHLLVWHGCTRNPGLDHDWIHLLHWLKKHYGISMWGSMAPKVGEKHFITMRKDGRITEQYTTPKFNTLQEAREATYRKLISWLPKVPINLAERRNNILNLEI